MMRFFILCVFFESSVLSSNDASHPELIYAEIGEVPKEKQGADFWRLLFSQQHHPSQIMSSSIAAISTTDSDEARALQFEQEIENKAPSTSNAQTTSTSTATSSKPAPSSSNNTKSNTGRKSTSNEIKNQSKDNQNPTSTSSNHPTTSTSTDTTSTRPTSSSIQHTSTNPTRSSGRKSREAKDKDQIKGKAPDVDRDGDVEMNQHPSKEISQKEQQTTDHQQDIREGDGVEHEEQNLPNPRLDIMRLGLERFMTVIDAKVR